MNIQLDNFVTIYFNLVTYKINIKMLNELTNLIEILYIFY